MFRTLSMAWDEVRSHPLRTLLTLLSVAIGVGAVVAIHCASTSARQAFVQLNESLTGEVDLEVVAEDGSRFDAKWNETVSGVSGVEYALPILRRSTILYARGRRTTTSALGVEHSHPRALASYKLVAGRYWRAGAESAGPGDRSGSNSSSPRTEVLLEANLAASLDLSAGDSATFLLPSGPTRTVVIGLLSPRSAASTTQSERVFFRLADLQQATRLNGKIDQLQVILAEGQSAEETRERLQAAIPPGMAVRTPVTQTDLADATLRAADQGLRFAQAIALAMALIIILNTFLISVAQRYRQWGLLRAIGATRRQVIGLLLSEALAVGLAGSVLGLVAGYFSARYLAEAIGRMLATPVHEIHLDPALVLFTMVLGPLLAVLGCYVPARKACRVSPIEALRGDVPSSDARVPWAVVLLACLVWTCSLLIIVLCIAGRLPASLVIPAGLGMMLGFVLMVPPILPPVARALTYLLLRPVWPAESRLALEQLFRSRLRASLTTAVVVVALANAVGLGHELLNSVDDVRDWYRRTMFADLFLIPATPELAAEFGLRAKDPPQARMQRIPGITSVQTMRFVPVRAGDRPSLLIARDFPDHSEPPWRLEDAEWSSVRSQLRQGGIVIGGALALVCHAQAGDYVRVEHAGRMQKLPIAAIVTDYHYGGLSLYMDRDAALSKLGVDGVSMFLVSLDAEQRESSARSLRELAAPLQLSVHSFDDLRSWLDGLMNGVVAAFWVVLGLGLVVASFGIFNTVTMNVLEQTREIGLLRIVGMTRRQVLKTVFSQGLLLASLGVLLGATAGHTTAFLMHLCKGPLLGDSSAFQWRPGMTVLVSMVSIALVLLASYGPARKAARLDALQSIQEE